jgi:hypothetical protein
MGSRNPLYMFVFRASSRVQMIPSERDLLQEGWDMKAGWRAARPLPVSPIIKLTEKWAIRDKGGFWLGDLDSNQGCPGQSREFYR